MGLKAIWSYESINGVPPKFNKAELSVIIASAVLWKKINPKDQTIFCCDNITKQYFDDLGILSIYDTVHIIDDDKTINKKVFWAASKLFALSAFEAPVVHIDLDFFTWSNFRELGFFDSYVSAAFEEECKHYYEPVSSVMKDVIMKDKIHWHNKAYNTCIMYFMDEPLKKKYCYASIDYMRKASETDTGRIFNRDKSLMMIFAEQQMFAEIAIKYKYKVKTLLKECLVAGKNKYKKTTTSNGIISEKNAEKHMVHLGDFKNKLAESEQLQNNVINHIESLLIQFNSPELGLLKSVLTKF